MPFANENVKYIAAEDVAMHYFPDQLGQGGGASGSGGGGSKTDMAKRMRIFSVSIKQDGDLKTLDEIDKTESGMLMLDYAETEHSTFISEMYSIAPPIRFVGKLSSC